MRYCGHCARVWKQAHQFCPDDGHPLRGFSTGVDPLVGLVLGDRYRLRAFLGAGGTGFVYVADHLDLNREVAVKMLFADRARDPANVKRLRREARALAALDHPNVVKVLDYGGGETDMPYLVMEKAMGRSLDSVLSAHGALPIVDVLRIGVQVASALVAAHDCGIVHRDLKPANIQVDTVRRELRARILDFGFAFLAEDSKVDRNESQSERLTRHGVIFGTPEYMAPEQIKGFPAQAHTDLYAFGIALYEMLSGKPPFFGALPSAVFSMHLDESPSPLHLTDDLPASIKEGLCALVTSLLSKDPQRRPSSAAVVMRELERLERAVASRGTHESWLCPPAAPVDPAAPTRGFSSVSVHVDAPDQDLHASEDGSPLARVSAGEAAGRLTGDAPREAPQPTGAGQRDRRAAEPLASAADAGDAGDADVKTEGGRVEQRKQAVPKPVVLKQAVLKQAVPKPVVPKPVVLKQAVPKPEARTGEASQDDSADPMPDALSERLSAAPSSRRPQQAPIRISGMPLPQRSAIERMSERTGADEADAPVATSKRSAAGQSSARHDNDLHDDDLHVDEGRELRLHRAVDAQRSSVSTTSHLQVGLHPPEILGGRSSLGLGPRARWNAELLDDETDDERVSETLTEHSLRPLGTPPSRTTGGAEAASSSTSDRRRVATTRDRLASARTHALDPHLPGAHHPEGTQLAATIRRGKRLGFGLAGVLIFFLALFGTHWIIKRWVAERGHKDQPAGVSGQDHHKDDAGIRRDNDRKKDTGLSP